jgi:hypothetical protein
MPILRLPWATAYANLRHLLSLCGHEIKGDVRFSFQTPGDLIESLTFRHAGLLCRKFEPVGKPQIACLADLNNLRLPPGTTTAKWPSQKN